MIKAALALLILVLGLARTADAAELDEAVAAAHRGEYATALRRLFPLAEEGDARAQFDMGFMHAYGWGVPSNPAEAITWYRKAADQGLQIAQHFLGIAYVNACGPMMRKPRDGSHGPPCRDFPRLNTCLA